MAVTDSALKAKIRAAVKQFAVFDSIDTESVRHKEVPLGLRGVKLHPAQRSSVLYAKDQIIVQRKRLL